MTGDEERTIVACILPPGNTRTVDEEGAPSGRRSA